MNPEVQYPELKHMKDSEMFVEWAYIVRPAGLLKLYLKKIIPKKERNIFVKALMLEYNVKEDLEDPNKLETVELVTIYR